MPNLLAKETSPYLLQHADNPVDWHPWGEDAFALARAEGKPVLLSIGYSACHWCHVMAHESFEDESTARLMNDLYVNIKVDREERPDIDRIYQTAHQLLTQRGGGWPLTMFLDPVDQAPFFGGTYFPDRPRYGMPAFTDLLASVAAYFRDRKAEVRDHARRLGEVLDRLEPSAADPGTVMDGQPLDEARRQLARSFDAEFGGFGGAPKFPQPAMIDRLLRNWRASASDADPDVDALFMATLTLTRMAEGGLFDHVGGGFYRYSVDRYWQIPHFEKMLYDNASLLAVFAQAHLATGEALFARAAGRTADWMLADMRAADGGYFASRDADSEGEEGKFYLWTPQEIAGLVDADAQSLLMQRYGLDQEPNFEGRWHLAVRQPVRDPDGEIDRALAHLADARQQRPAPGRDEKQLSSWNALAIRGLAIAGRALGREELITAAGEAAAFLRKRLFVDGRLRASFKDGRARFPAYLDDHAFLIDALLELVQARWDRNALDFAIELAELLLQHFYDAAGGFFFTADDHEVLLHRSKPLADEAMPSGNGVAAFALQRLGLLLGEQRYTAAAEQTLRCAWHAMHEYPRSHASLLNALEEYLEPPEIVVYRGEAGEISRLHKEADRLYAPNRMMLAIPADEAGLPGLLAERGPADGEVVIYRCVGTHCELVSDRTLVGR